MQSFNKLNYGDEIRYVGPDEVGSPFATPLNYETPYQFQHVSAGGTLSCLTWFNGRKRLAPEHPCNNPAYWEVA